MIGEGEIEANLEGEAEVEGVGDARQDCDEQLEELEMRGSSDFSDSSRQAENGPMQIEPEEQEEEQKVDSVQQDNGSMVRPMQRVRATSRRFPRQSFVQSHRTEPNLQHVDEEVQQRVA